jgi:excisionase family DNA binding protein
MEIPSVAVAVPIVIPRMAYSIAESEALIGLSRSSIYRMLEAGTLKAVKYGRRRLIPAREIDRILSTEAL